jgi:hypothetical protein
MSGREQCCDNYTIEQQIGQGRILIGYESNNVLRTSGFITFSGIPRDLGRGRHRGSNTNRGLFRQEQSVLEMDFSEGVTLLHYFWRHPVGVKYRTTPHGSVPIKTRRGQREKYNRQMY